MLTTFTIAIIFTILQKISAQDGNWQSRLVIELTTPGVQTPPNNPFNLSFFDDIGPNQLLPNGERMHFLLGNQIQVLFSSILNDQTKQRNIKIYSSPLKAAQQSASAHLIGIFPNFENDRVVQGLELLKDPPYLPLTVERLDSDAALPHKQKPFDMEVESFEEDFLFMTNMGEVCPSLEAMVAGKRRFGVRRSDFEFALIKLRRYLSHIKFFGKEVQMLKEHHLVALYDSMMAYYYFNGKMYNKFTKTALRRLGIVKGLSMLGRELRSEPVRRLVNHHIMSKVMEEFANAKKYSNYNTKYVLLSGTELSMMSLLRSFNKTSYACLRQSLANLNKTESEDCREMPKPASAMTMELLYHQQRKEFYVKMMYNGYPLKICENGTRTFCEYKQWLTLIKTKIISPNFFDACGNDKVGMVEEDRKRKEIVSTSFTVKVLAGLLVFEVLIAILVFYFRMKSNDKVVENALMETLGTQKYQFHS